MNILIEQTEPVNDTHLRFKRVSSGGEFVTTDHAFDGHKLVVPVCLVIFIMVLLIGFRGWL